MKKKFILSSVLALFLNSSFAADIKEEALLSMSLEDLLNTPVDSLYKTPHDYFSTAAAMTVITKEDIENSGASSLADVLTRVSGLFVGRLSQDRFTTTIRKEMQYFNDSMLVLVDGKSVYATLTNAMYWNLVEVPLVAIEKIEIIKGAGWGSNTSGGVVNIITKSSLGDSKNEASLAAGNFGYKKGAAFVKTKLSEHQAIALSAEVDAANGFESDAIQMRKPKSSIGIFRYDGDFNGVKLFFDAAALQSSDNLASSAGVGAKENSSSRSIHLKVSKDFGEDSLSLSSYIRETKGDYALFKLKDSYALTSYYELSYKKQLSERSSLQLSAEYRKLDTKNLSSSIIYFGKDFYHEDAPAFSAMYEQLLDGDVKLNVGVREEGNVALNENKLFTYDLRVSKLLNSDTSIWLAHSKIYQEPQKGYVDISTVLSFKPPATFYIAGIDPTLKSEASYSYQIGARYKGISDFLLECAAYYVDGLNKIARAPDRVATIKQPNGTTWVEMLPENILNPKSYGGEIGVKYIKNDIQNNFTFTFFRQDNTANRAIAPSNKQYAPAYKLTNELKYDFNKRFSADIFALWESGHPLEANPSRFVPATYYSPSHLKADINLIYKLKKDIELSIGAKDLFNDAVESFSSFVTAAPQKIRPSYTAKLTYRF